MDQTTKHQAIRVWFVVPVFGRFELTAVCLRQLRRTCDGLQRYGLEGTAVVVGDDANLAVADELGFATVKQDNSQLGRKFNDGYQLACDPAHNPNPADYVVPCGSDDWIDPVIFRELPRDGIGIFRQLAVVDENKTEIAKLRLGYTGGAGVRIIPHKFIAACERYRPADDDRKRAIDTSSLHGITSALRGNVPLVPLDVHEYQIVDWKSSHQQLNSYGALVGYRRGQTENPFEVLSEFYPSEALEEMQSLSMAVAA